VPKVEKQGPKGIAGARIGNGNTSSIRSTLSHGKIGAKGSILSQVKKLNFDDSDGIKILLYGQSGTGKTTTWATFPSPILAVVISGGEKPGELRSVFTKENQDRIHPIYLKSSKDILTLIEELKETDTGFATVVLDHASGLQDMILAEILGLDNLPAQKGWGLASQQQYGQCTLQCKEALRGLLSLSANVCIIAQERVFNDEADSDIIRPTVGAGLTPSLTGWLNTAVDYIVQTYKRQREEIVRTKVGEGKNAKTIETRKKLKGVEYCLRIGPDATFTTKFRLPKGNDLPDSVVIGKEDSAYTKIMRVIKGEEE
jgi:hypothetical protein